MKKYEEAVVFCVLSGLVFLMTGCMQMKDSVNEPLDPLDAEQQMNAATLKRFQDTTVDDGPTAVDSAIELSKKYAALSDETAKLKLEKQNLINENKRLKQKITVLEPELAQVKKELTQANDLLIEMRLELNNWKADVLGFRDEMRQADKAQLEALVKILEVLGGETEDISTQPDSNPEAG